MPMLNIGSTKQLFFDDYLIESLVNARQGLNPAVKVDDNPVLRPERPWEGNFMRPAKVIFDPTDRIFRMWYSSATIAVRLEDGKPVRGGAAGARPGPAGRRDVPGDLRGWNPLGAAVAGTGRIRRLDGQQHPPPEGGAAVGAGVPGSAREGSRQTVQGDAADRGHADPGNAIRSLPFTGCNRMDSLRGQSRHRYRAGAGALVGPFPGMGPDTRDLLRHHGSQPPLAGTLRQTANRQGGKPGHDSLERAGDHPRAGRGRLPRHRVLQHAGLPLRRVSMSGCCGSSAPPT